MIDTSVRDEEQRGVINQKSLVSALWPRCLDEIQGHSGVHSFRFWECATIKPFVVYRCYETILLLLSR
jgi:hypothetical protein